MNSIVHNIFGRLLDEILKQSDPTFSNRVFKRVKHMIDVLFPQVVLVLTTLLE